MAAVRDFADGLEGYAYLPRMFDKARARLSGDTDAPQFGCPLDHSCLARLRVYPEDVLGLVSGNYADDRAILAGLRDLGIPPATDAWFSASARCGSAAPARACASPRSCPIGSRTSESRRCASSG